MEIWDRPGTAHTQEFAVGDVVMLQAEDRDGVIRQTWLSIDSASDETTHWAYGWTYESGDRGVVYPISSTVINWGASGEGVVRTVTSGTYPNYIEALTHAGSPWTTVTAHGVFGNLQGYTAIDEWGIATGADLTTLTGDYVVLSDGRAYFNQTIEMTTGKGIQHADGGTLGWALVDDGTGFYSPGAVTGGGGIDLVATRGAIIYGDAVPDWAVMAHPGAAFRHLETSALDFAWVADLQLDDGVGDSPTLTWQDGDDDFAYMYLDVSEGEKTFIIDVDASGTASAPQIYIKMDGDLEFSFTTDMFRVWPDSGIMMADDSWIGLSAADGRIEFDDQATDEVLIKNAILILDEESNDYAMMHCVSSDVAHGMTTQYDNGVFGSLSKFENNYGGLRITGLTESGITAKSAVRIRGFLGEAADTTRSVSGTGIVSIGAWVKSGTDVNDAATTGNLFSVDNGGSDNTAFIVGQASSWFAGLLNCSASGIRTKVSTANVDDIEPTDAELDATFGTAATVGAGYIGLVDDNNAHVRVWLVASDGTNWWRIQLSIAP